MKTKLITGALLLYVLAAMVLLCSTGCMTADKATGYLSAHKEVAANYCATEFPVKQETTVQVVEDTAKNNQVKHQLNDYKDSVLRKAAEKNDSIDKLKNTITDLQEAGAYTQATADVLQAQLKGIKKVDTSGLRKSIEAEIWKTIVPCKDSVVTIVKENTAAAQAQQLRGDRLQGELDAMRTGRDNWRKWCLITWGIIAAYVLLRVFTAKLGIISKFIK